MAALCGLVLFARVYAEFPSIRWKVVEDTRPSDRGSVSIDVPYVARLAETPGPLVVIARLENPSPNDVTINISWNAVNIASTSVGAGQTKRVDLTLPDGQTLRGEDRIRFRGPEGPWRLRYLELSNLHGMSRGLITAVIVPSAVRATTAFEWPMVLLITIVLIGLVFVQGPPWANKWGRYIHGGVIAIIATLFAVSLFSAFVSPYQVLLAWDKFWILMAVAFARGLWRALVGLREVISPRLLGSKAAFDSIVVAVITTGFFIAVMITRLEQHKGNYSGFLQLDKTFIERSPLLEGRDDVKSTLSFVQGGYDGQFMYMMAFDPFMSTFKDDPRRYFEVVDTPPYRYTRIGYSLLTKLFAWDQPILFPQTMIWLILAAHFCAALALGAIIRHHGGHPAWAMLYAIVPGFLQSLNAGLPESIAAAGLLASTWLILKSRWVFAALVLGATLLVRETSVAFVVMMVLWLWLSKREWRGGFIVGLSIGALVAWRAFITWRLYPIYGMTTFLFTPGNIGMPFKGFVDLWAVIGRGEYFLDYPPLAVAGRLFPIVLTSALIVSLVLLWKRRDGLSAAAVAASLIAVSLDYANVLLHVGNAERVSFDVFVLLLASFGMIVSDRRVAAGAAGADSAGAAGAAGVSATRSLRGLRVMLLVFFAATAVYTVYYSFDAPMVRHVLFTPADALF
jgi:hypothetical protein